MKFIINRVAAVLLLRFCGQVGHGYKRVRVFLTSVLFTEIVHR